jgi:hypothetical protein
MIIKSAQKFSSKRTGLEIKVTKIKRSTVSSKYDSCTVGDSNFGYVIKGTQRVIQADSIRRRYV